MILTLKELADYLRVNERTILRMLKSGQIKGAKIGGQWRFNGSQIDGLFFPDSPPTEDAVPLSAFSRPHVGIPLSRTMDPSRMVMDMVARDAEAAIGELTAPKLLGGYLLDAAELHTKCLAREKLLSTGVGDGVAIPHPRDPIPALRVPALVVFGRSEAGIDFKSADGNPVHLFFVVCCQTIELHLHLMGSLARLLRSTDFIANCRTTREPSEILRMILEFERDRFLSP